MTDTMNSAERLKICIEVCDVHGNDDNEFGVLRNFLQEVTHILTSVSADYDSEIGDMTACQMLEYADAFSQVSACARRWERHLRGEAKASFY